jgi:hypothetical protein
MMIGGVVAALFLGLPLAIIGLFIASTLDRRHGKPPDVASREPSHVLPAADEGIDRRRRVIYGRQSAVATAKRHELGRIRDRKV